MKNESIAISYCINVPEDATNGDVIKAMFPDAEPIRKYNDSIFIRAWKPFFVACEFDIGWWNAKYKAEREDKE